MLENKLSRAGLRKAAYMVVVGVAGLSEIKANLAQAMLGSALAWLRLNASWVA